MKKILLAALLSVPLMGCNSTTNDDVAKGDGYRCEQVKTLGSSIPKKRCTTKEQRELIRSESHDSLRNHQRAGTVGENSR
ncbi:hypothetical protein [Pseudoalteromonas sp. T1lg23B]|uniref:hypothetical protein n=1 Tax=Pseudoalteromonas sp. T1lg23B TaxID=2077097 RepID=UPI000CF714DC|nr:hypothetical protein [Pseudoalteromonas sp. T1lg23B]